MTFMRSNGSQVNIIWQYKPYNQPPPPPEPTDPPDWTTWDNIWSTMWNYYRNGNRSLTEEYFLTFFNKNNSLREQKFTEWLNVRQYWDERNEIYKWLYQTPTPSPDTDLDDIHQQLEDLQYKLDHASLIEKERLEALAASLTAEATSRDMELKDQLITPWEVTLATEHANAIDDYEEALRLLLIEIELAKSKNLHQTVSGLQALYQKIHYNPPKYGVKWAYPLEEVKGQITLAKNRDPDWYRVQTDTEIINQLAIIMDDLGLLRTITFMIGALCGYTMDDAILQIFGNEVQAQIHEQKYSTQTWNPDTKSWGEPILRKTFRRQDAYTEPTAISKALSWSSRWITGIPLYELVQMGLYPDQAPIRSSLTKPIFWKHEFWGTKKYFNIKYWDLSRQGYNYKASTLALRTYLANQDKTLEKVGYYSNYH